VYLEEAGSTSRKESTLSGGRNPKLSIRTFSLKGIIAVVGLVFLF
jgi:hypothetical protein